MNPNPPSLRFQIDPGELKVSEMLDAMQGVLRSLPDLEALRAAASPAFLLSAARQAADLVKDLVDISLADVLVSAWKQHQRFSKYKDARQFPPEKSSTVELLEHHIKSTHKPYIELSVDGKTAGKIPFELALDIHVQGLVLVLQGNRVMRIEAARAKLAGTLKCAGKTVFECKSQDLPWKKGISLGSGIPIVAAA